jgi:hypothetical protein
MPSVLQQQHLEVEQLRREAGMKRIPVSQAVEDIKVSSIVIGINVGGRLFTKNCPVRDNGVGIRVKLLLAGVLRHNVHGSVLTAFRLSVSNSASFTFSDNIISLFPRKV